MTHAKKLIDGISNKYCYHCKEYKPVTEFYKDAHKKDGLSDECKTCITEVQREYQHSYYLRKRAIKQDGDGNGSSKSETG